MLEDICDNNIEKGGPHSRNRTIEECCLILMKEKIQKMNMDWIWKMHRILERRHCLSGWGEGYQYYNYYNNSMKEVNNYSNKYFLL